MLVSWTSVTEFVTSTLKQWQQSSEISDKDANNWVDDVDLQRWQWSADVGILDVSN